MSTATKAATQYLASFTEFERRAAGSELLWLRQLRREAFAYFCEVGFPTTHNEDWRFTSVAAIASTTFRPASREDAGAQALRQRVEELGMQGAGGRLVFFNGHFAAELSEVSRLPDGVTAASLARELEKAGDGSGLLQTHLAHYADLRRDGFSALNMAFAEDGAVVHVPRGAVVEEPIYLLFLSTLDEASPAMNHPRTLILADENSQLSIVEDYVWLGSGRGLCNAVTELVAAEGAVVSHYRIEREQAGPDNIAGFNISTLGIRQERSANVASHAVLLGGALVRNNVHPVLAGEGGECLINGLFLGAGKEHIDNYMLVEHASPHCASRQFYNGILDDHAHGVFHGRIIVQRVAQKTDAKQTNRNLLLSDDAQIDTKPQLEIRADDVKCTHGATIGQIEEDALFYLRSRGVDEVSARRLLLLAFAEECIARMQEGPARQHVEKLVRQHVQRFKGHAAQGAKQE